MRPRLGAVTSTRDGRARQETDGDAVENETDDGDGDEDVVMPVVAATRARGR